MIQRNTPLTGGEAVGPSSATASTVGAKSMSPQPPACSPESRERLLADVADIVERYIAPAGFLPTPGQERDIRTLVGVVKLAEKALAPPPASSGELRRLLEKGPPLPWRKANGNPLNIVSAASDAPILHAYAFVGTRGQPAYTAGLVLAAVNALPALLSSKEGLERENAALRRTRRWNIDREGSDLLICEGDHERHETCVPQRFVSADRLSTAETQLAELAGVAREARDYISGDSILSFRGPVGDQIAEQLDLALAKLSPNTTDGGGR